MSVLISASAGELPFHAAPDGGAYPGHLMNTTGIPVKKTWGMQEEDTTPLARWFLYLYQHPVERGLILRTLDEYANEGQVSVVLVRRIILERLFQPDQIIAFLAFMCASWISNWPEKRWEALDWRGSALIVLGAVMLSAGAWYAFRTLTAAHLLLRTTLNARRSKPALPPALVLRGVRPSVWPLFYASMSIPRADDLEALRRLFHGVLDGATRDPEAHAVFTRVLELEADAGLISLWHRHSRTFGVAAVVCLIADVVRRAAVAALGPHLNRWVLELTFLAGNLLYFIANLTCLPLFCLHARYCRAAVA